MTAAPATAAMAAAAESLQSNVELVLGATVGALTPDQRRLLETGWRNGRRLLGLIGDLHTVALVEAGLLEHDWEALDFRELATRAAEDAWPVAHATGRRIRLETTGSPHAIGASGLLARALGALLEYVVEHARRGGEIVVSVGDGAVELAYPAHEASAADELPLALASAAGRLHGGELAAGYEDGTVTLALTLGTTGEPALAA